MVLLAVMSTVITACSGTSATGEDESALNGPGRWTLPADVLAIGARARLEYDAAPRWSGASTCSGKLRTGSRRLGEYLRDNFEVIRSIGGYACRRNTADGSRMSVHGTGRALDVFIPVKNGGADNLRGDKVANFLVVNAQRIGVQLVIWDRSVWRANGTNAGPYGGPHPHDDHIHVELTDEGGAAATPWFSDMSPYDGGASDDAATSDAASPDAARADASTSTDAGAPPPEDAGTTTPDAGGSTAPDAGSGEPPTEPTPPGGGESEGTVTPDGPPSSGEPPPGTGFELPEGDEPEERDSLGSDSPPKKKARASEDDEPMPSSGCSAAASGNGPPATGLALGAMVLALGLASRRRRR